MAEPAIDFRPESEAQDDATAVDQPKTELAAPLAKSRSEITWRWATAADIQALRLHHFQAEVACGEAMYLPEGPSTLRAIAVAEKDGKIIGGVMGEDSVLVTLVGMDPEVLESAGAVVLPIFVAQARKEGTRFLHGSLPAQLAAILDNAFQKAGFKPVDGTQYRLDTGIEAEEQHDGKQGRQ